MRVVQRDGEIQLSADRGAQALANTVWLQADVTANDDTDKALLKHFGIYGPPTIAFYGKDGVERREYRVVGFMKPEPFAQLVAKALEPNAFACNNGP